MSDKVTFSQIVEELAAKTDSSQSLCHDFVTNLTEIVVNSAMESGKASITNFGSFKVVDVAARNGVNPQTGESIVIPAHQRLSFTPYKALESTVNASFSHLEATVIEDDTSPKPSSAAKAELVVTSLKEESEANEETVKEESVKPEPPVFKRPGKEEKAGNIQNVLLVVVVLLMVVVGLWFFVFRETSEPEIVEPVTPPPPVEVPADPTPNPPPAADQTAIENDSPDESSSSNIADAPVEEKPAIQEENETRDTSEYLVGKDDWIYDIARKTYQNPNFWPLIFEANYSASQDPDLIIPGKELTVPALQNSQNPTPEDRNRLASAHRVVSEAYANAGKSEKANSYSRMALRFSN